MANVLSYSLTMANGMGMFDSHNVMLMSHLQADWQLAVRLNKNQLEA
jgi:hypothetical protein